MIIANFETESKSNEEGTESWDYLVLYDENNVILSKSKPFAPDEEPFLEYDGLSYMAKRNGEIFITLESINNKFSNKS